MEVAPGLGNKKTEKKKRRKLTTQLFKVLTRLLKEKEGERPSVRVGWRPSYLVSRAPSRGRRRAGIGPRGDGRARCKRQRQLHQTRPRPHRDYWHGAGATAGDELASGTAGGGQRQRDGGGMAPGEQCQARVHRRRDWRRARARRVARAVPCHHIASPRTASRRGPMEPAMRGPRRPCRRPCRACTSTRLDRRSWSCSSAGIGAWVSMQRDVASRTPPLPRQATVYACCETSERAVRRGAYVQKTVAGRRRELLNEG